MFLMRRHTQNHNHDENDFALKEAKPGWLVVKVLNEFNKSRNMNKTLQELESNTEFLIMKRSHIEITLIKQVRSALGTLSGHSLKYCSDGCLRRYLEAQNWNVDKAKKMLEETLKWRSTYKPHQIRWPEVAHEGETGKVSRTNFHDRQGRTVLIMRPGMQNTNSPENNIRHLVYLIENGIMNLPEGQEQMSWLIDFTGFSLSTNIQIKTARDIIYILQSHYPERLAIFFLYNPPRIFQAFFKAIRYFIDPKTSQKMKFVYPKNKESVELMISFFDIDNLPSEFGGKATLKYDHQEFSKMMAEDDIKTAKFWGIDEKPLPV